MVSTKMPVLKLLRCVALLASFSMRLRYQTPLDSASKKNKMGIAERMGWPKKPIKTKKMTTKGASTIKWVVAVVRKLRTVW